MSLVAFFPNGPEPPVLGCEYDGGREVGTRDFLQSILDADHGITFRENLVTAIQKGRGIARTDDSNALSTHICHWKRSPTYKLEALGWGNQTCASLLATESMDLADEELLEQLRDGITEAPCKEPFRGLYLNSQFSDDPINPIKGLFRSQLFIDAAKTVMNGPGCVKTGRSGGSRGKAAKGGVSSVNAESIAYIAMILRFVLRNEEKWYRVVDSEVDARFDYDQFYIELLTALEEPLFEAEAKDLITFLNLEIFPHSHARPNRIRTGGSTLRQRAEAARALASLSTEGSSNSTTAAAAAADEETSNRDVGTNGAA
ncbi:hypothetical protein RSOLAG22IIIB_08011 [Rhizoctonia solani]|uniref:Uncharacterized protein n=1 Tax=Rhizoctonia solani TaxID=456999 RepID=A0A0K6FR11_9AGAM|nr:hypothetical protein RSOLAG22IIIB_08011 [Rhizoctonia solani]